VADFIVPIAFPLNEDAQEVLESFGNLQSFPSQGLLLSSRDVSLTLGLETLLGLRRDPLRFFHVFEGVSLNPNTYVVTSGIDPAGQIDEVVYERVLLFNDDGQVNRAESQVVSAIVSAEDPVGSVLDGDRLPRTFDRPTVFGRAFQGPFGTPVAPLDNEISDLNLRCRREPGVNGIGAQMQLSGSTLATIVFVGKFTEDPSIPLG